jgi:WXG100 family type VII secretion target
MSQNQMGQGAGTLTRAAGLVSEAKRDFDALSVRLEGQITGMAGQWVGAGGSAFQALQAAWTERQRVITRALDEFEASLRSTEKDFMSTDDQQSSTHVALQNRLG